MTFPVLNLDLIINGHSFPPSPRDSAGDFKKDIPDLEVRRDVSESRPRGPLVTPNFQASTKVLSTSIKVTSLEIFSSFSKGAL